MQLNEPVRKSVLEVLQGNFAIANRRIYLHRLIYIGKHTFQCMADLVTHFQTVVTTINNKYCDEKITGFMLFYPQFFCHVLDGSEDSLQKHIRRLVKEHRFGTVKVLVVYHNINQRFNEEWTYVTGKPQLLLEAIDVNSDLKQTSQHILRCITKLYNLGFALRKYEAALNEPSPTNSTTAVEEESVPQPLARSHRQSLSRKNIASMITVPIVKRRPSEILKSLIQPNCLPEYTLLEFLLDTAYTTDMREYGSGYGKMNILDEYEDQVWPIASDNVPMNVFEKDRDPVNDLPLEAMWSDESGRGRFCNNLL